MVEVLDTEGSKFIGKLKDVTGGGFELETEMKIKGKTMELKETRFFRHSIM